MQYLENKGLFVGALANNHLLAYDCEGKLGEFSPNTIITIAVAAKRKRQLNPIVVHRHQNGDGTHDFSLITSEQIDNELIYVWEVIVEGKLPTGYTKWPVNQIHLVQFGREGKFDLIQISLPSQNNIVYLRIQQLYSGRVELINDKPVVNDPHFSHWSELLPFLVEQMKDRKLLLASELDNKLSWSEVVDEEADFLRPTTPRQAPENIPYGQAWIVHWNDSRGSGWAYANISPTDFRVPAKIHWSKIQMPGFRHLEDGAMVTFERADFVVEGGLKRYHLIGVKPVGPV